MKKIIFFLFISSFSCYSQHSNLPLGRSYLSDLDKILYTKKQQTHTSFKPILRSNLSFLTDSIIKIYYPTNYDRGYLRKIFSEHLFIIQGDGYRVIASPIINISKGKVKKSC